MSDAIRFLAGCPVWPTGRERAMNDFVGFRAVFARPEGGHALLRFTTPYIARVFLNGKFLAYGPARAAHGYYRVDEIDLTPRLQPEQNVLAVEVAGYNVNSYYFLDQPSFFMAEVVAGPLVVAATGRDFEVIDLPERVRNVQRFSFQRPFSEVYHLTPNCHAWRTEIAPPTIKCAFNSFPQPRLLPRRCAYPNFDTLHQPTRVESRGTFTRGELPAQPWKDRSLTTIGPQLKGFTESELAWIPSLEYQRFRFSLEPCAHPYRPQEPITLQARDAITLGLGANRTGFLGFTIEVRRTTRLILAVDEVLADDGSINIGRIDSTYVPSWDLEPGEYAIETFEPYTLRYLRLCVPEGDCTIRGIYLRDYAAPPMSCARYVTSDPTINDVFRAAVETARQNAVDLFFDDPSRERAGWLCDAFFQARAFFDLTASTAVEHAFLENVLLAPEPFPNLPEGEIPAAYPADFYEGLHIPQWPCWLVMQLEEYLQRSGDAELVAAFGPKIEKFLAFLGRHRNSDGLLERLPGWNFLEWSFANECTQDVNYPINMLYAATLDAAARVWHHPEWAQGAEHVRTQVRSQSWDGEFFVDNAVRSDGQLCRTRNRTEMCQYFAFYFGTATPESHPRLWSNLIEHFGPTRDAGTVFPEIHPANALIGYLLRFELLANSGRTEQLLRELKAYYGRMAQRTGTLWEHNDLRASACQGFASHVVRWMISSVLGVEAIDPVARQISLRSRRIPLDWIDAEVPLASGSLTLRWQANIAEPIQVLSVPAGWNIVIQQAEPDGRPEKQLRGKP
ncbi:MAG TPA: hypothetical protein VGN72_03570 [Tepidisphaeraceae bacterium]|jgi:alpha-L-rhamnosidase|nr:hypothetical protein [Tepidisphaeraceae bacterium]